MHMCSHFCYKMEHYGIFPKHYGIGYRALNHSSETSRDISVEPHFWGDAISAFQISNIIFSHVIEYDVSFNGICVFPLLSKMSPTKPSLNTEDLARVMYHEWVTRKVYNSAVLVQTSTEVTTLCLTATGWMFTSAERVFWTVCGFLLAIRLNERAQHLSSSLATKDESDPLSYI